jgi:hypothetical protein
MATQIIIALCEGPHDVAFLTRIFKSIGFISNENKKLNEFPHPMDKLMSQEVTQTQVEELNLQEIRKNFLPSNTIQKDDNYIFMFSMHGDGKREPRKKILRNLRLNVREEGEIKTDRPDANTQLSVIYFFDSDNRGVASRLLEISNEIKEVLPSIPTTAFNTNGAVCTIEGIKIGCYIFTGADNNTGKLEDILVPIMNEGNESIFNNAKKYLQDHYDDSRLFPLKLKNENGVTTETRSARGREKFDYDEKKSLLGVVGQLQKSGKANTVCISDTDFLNLNKIKVAPKCKEIIEFINKFTTITQ